jgi:quinol monooxygenase YgiN
VPYGYIGSMKTQPGQCHEVISILLAGIDDLRAAGCDFDVASEADTDEDTIVVMEVWETKQHHEASLELPETKAAIAKAMPMLTGEFTGQELSVVGGVGVSSHGDKQVSH